MPVTSFSNPVDLFLSELSLRGVNTALSEVQLVIESLRSGSLGSGFASAAAENAYISGKSIVFYAGLLPDGTEAFQAAQKFVGANRSQFYFAGETPMNGAFTNLIDGQFGFKNSFPSAAATSSPRSRPARRSRPFWEASARRSICTSIPPERVPRQA